MCRRILCLMRLNFWHQKIMTGGFIPSLFYHGVLICIPSMTVSRVSRDTVNGLIQFGNDSLSNFKAERFVQRFQPLFLCFDVSLDLRYHRRELFLAFLSCLGVYVMRFALSVSVSRAVSAFEKVVVYHRHTARFGFATFGLVRLEIGRCGILPLPVPLSLEFRRLSRQFGGLSSLLLAAASCRWYGCRYLSSFLRKHVLLSLRAFSRPCRFQVPSSRMCVWGHETLPLDSPLVQA